MQNASIPPHYDRTKAGMASVRERRNLDVDRSMISCGARYNHYGENRQPTQPAAAGEAVRGKQVHCC